LEIFRTRVRFPAPPLESPRNPGAFSLTAHRAQEPGPCDGVGANAPDGDQDRLGQAVVLVDFVGNTSVFWPNLAQRAECEYLAGWLDWSVPPSGLLGGSCLQWLGLQPLDLQEQAAIPKSSPRLASCESGPTFPATVVSDCPQRDLADPRSRSSHSPTRRRSRRYFVCLWRTNPCDRDAAPTGPDRGVRPRRRARRLRLDQRPLGRLAGGLGRRFGPA
jgi:hypothetical protein